MCEYCDSNSSFCEYFVEPLDGVWYQEVQTAEWDSYNDDFVCERNYGVKYCQYCGRKLDEDDKNDK